MNGARCIEWKLEKVYPTYLAQDVQPVKEKRRHWRDHGLDISIVISLRHGQSQRRIWRAARVCCSHFGIKHAKFPIQRPQRTSFVSKMRPGRELPSHVGSCPRTGLHMVHTRGQNLRLFANRQGKRTCKSTGLGKIAKLDPAIPLLIPRIGFWAWSRVPFMTAILASGEIRNGANEVSRIGRPGARVGTADVGYPSASAGKYRRRLPA